VRWLRRAGGAALTALAAGAVLAALPASAPAAAPSGDRPAAAPADPALFPQGAPKPATVVVGVPGLRWSDVRGETPTPALWVLAREAALAALSVRTAEPAACPADGWLTLNAGARAIAPRPDGRCAPVPDPQGRGTTATVPDWSALIAPNDDYSYDPVWGTLADARPGAPPAAADQRCAVGPGAALALADAAGRVRATYAADPGQLPAGGCADLLVLDAGALPSGPDRLRALRDVDELIGQLRAALPDSALMVAGISDTDPDDPHLSALMVEAGEDALRGLRRGWLRSESTRRTGVVTITDLTPTLVRDPVPADLDGNPLQFRPRVESTPTAVRELSRLDTAAQVVRDMFVWFFTVLIAGQLLAYLAAALALRAGRISRGRCAQVLTVVGLGFGAVPAATVLATLLPWPAAAHPALALWGLVLAGAGAIAALALTGPWRRRRYGSAAAVGLVTVAVFGLDVVLGSRLQLNSLFGLSPLIAGRFYGFGNIAFAVFAVAALMAAAGGAAALLRRGRPRAAGVLVLAIGALAALVDGWPDFGADFGGVLALLPGVAVLAAGVSGIRLTVARAVAVGAVTVAVAGAIAVLDWRRDAAQRSHLGRFVQDVLDGEGPDVIGRKLDANLGLLVDAPVIVAAAVPLVVLAVLALFRPERLGLHPLARAQAADPVLRPLLLACLCTALVGFAVNDSGVIVPAVALIAAGPLAVAIWAGLWAEELTVRQRRGLTAGDGGAAPAARGGTA
jgi:hypothetical protein